jgi:hypothetical protein
MEHKIKLLKKISLISLLIAIILTIFIIFSAQITTGCYTRSKVEIIENTNNINIDFKPHMCISSFKIINREPDLIIYNLKELERTQESQYYCLRRFTDTLRNIDLQQECPEIILELNKEYQIMNIKDMWELETNKGNITGKTTYYKVGEISQKIHLSIAIISLIISISSYIALIFIKKRNKKNL